MKNQKLIQFIDALIFKDQEAASKNLSEYIIHKSKTILSEKKVDNSDPEERMVPIESVKKGTFVKRKADAKKVYKVAGFDNSTKKYLLDDEDDISKQIGVKKGTKVFVGFEY